MRSGFDSHRRNQYCQIAQWQSLRLLTEWLWVRVPLWQPLHQKFLLFCAKTDTAIFKKILAFKKSVLFLCRVRRKVKPSAFQAEDYRFESDTRCHLKSKIFN